MRKLKILISLLVFADALILPENFQNVDLTDECFIPAGFPDKTVKRIRDLKICGQNLFVDLNCEKTDCSCLNAHVQKDNTYKKLYDFLNHYSKATVQKTRRNSLLDALKLPNKLNDGLVLMQLNSGFIWLLQNFLCSCEHHNINIRNMLLIVAGDRKVENFAESMRINYISGIDLYLSGTKMVIRERAAEKFGWGSHGDLNIIGMAVFNDFIQLGKTVLLQDVDVVWRRNPWEYLLAGSKKADIQMMYDANGHQDKTPGNTGFIFAPSNCRTKILTSTIMKHIWLSYVFAKSDQSVWNTILKSQPFRQLTFVTLPEKLFINGHQFHEKHSQWPLNIALQHNYYAVHVSWTGAAIPHKIDKLKKVNSWYIGPKRNCTYARDVELLTTYL